MHIICAQVLPFCTLCLPHFPHVPWPSFHLSLLFCALILQDVISANLSSISLCSSSHSIISNLLPPTPLTNTPPLLSQAVIDFLSFLTSFLSRPCMHACQILILGKEVFHFEPKLYFVQSDLFFNVQPGLWKYPLGKRSASLHHSHGLCLRWFLLVLKTAHY